MELGLAALARVARAPAGPTAPSCTFDEAARFGAGRPSVPQHLLGELVHHAGEEFVYVLSGRVTVNTEYYDSVTLEAGQSIYFDSSMGHAYLAAEGCDEAVVLAVMSSPDDELLQSLMSIHEGQQAGK